MTDEPPARGGDRLPDDLRAALRAIAVRAAAATHLSPPAGEAVLRSIVEATVTLFDAEAASIALYDPATNELVFRVAAGSHGDGVVGLAIRPDQGVAGYVFTTGQPLAISDVAADSRFGRAAAEQTGYMPRSLVAVPLVDDDGALGVLEVLDRRSQAAFDLRDIELASVFARQAAVAIRSSRLERDVRSLLTETLGRLAASDAAASDAAAADATAAIEAIVDDVCEGLDDDDSPLWALATEVGRLRRADPAQVDLVRDMLALLADRAERAADARARRRAR